MNVVTFRSTTPLSLCRRPVLGGHLLIVGHMVGFDASRIWQLDMHVLEAATTRAIEVNIAEAGCLKNGCRNRERMHPAEPPPPPRRRRDTGPV